MDLRTGRVVVELDFRRLGFDQGSDLQAGFRLVGQLPEQVAVAGQLDFVENLQRLTAVGCGLEVGDHGAVRAADDQVDGG
ncbi:MAG: hypothetical protein NTY19_07230 [Planctomycetota bacterium]|nr:hypothetical protein [Planctomycetota bacterium]